ncbi:MAG: hypothetical protein EZS26_003736 [Candidatus Ordinivivax streblomastigis]|uniref:Porin n=1 Tax=Candidatus Ordinivivax streblomastigis TaxID=2540710 RepID=A0A5M8NUX6_9BACT|nr:MAG: hypothetical protein EZS26_003736 [Candidatus Ordinivivax streblomastigis]
MLVLLFFTLSASAQDSIPKGENPFRYSGQLSGWTQFTPDIPLKGWLGARYIPQLNYKVSLEKERLLDVEVSANIVGDMGFSPFDSLTTDGNMKPYRAWVRYSTNRMELRLGLQKINFGSAQMFRPLMWFDHIDPRDPLQLTDGVWGLLYWYYFQNNTNIWLWGLYGNKDTKGWEITPVNKRYPEGGGRVQISVPYGETALSYHFRQTDATSLSQTGAPVSFDRIAENRLGFDTRLDVVVGLWFEASWTTQNKDLGMYTNQEMMTLGTDYTFGIGNGLAATFEQLIFSYDRNAFAFANAATFSGLSLSYPLGMSDKLNTITYYDWANNDTYLFLNWQKELNHFTFYLMGYWNPKTYALPGQSLESNRFAGKGLQLMVVWNH